MSDEREGTIRSVLSEARDQTADVADQVKSAAEDWYGQARDSASLVADAAGRSMKVARYTASSLEEVGRNTIENQPYTAAPTRGDRTILHLSPSPVAIAFGAWMAARTHAPPLVGCGRHTRLPSADRVASQPGAGETVRNIRDTSGPTVY